MANSILNETKAYKLTEINHIIGGILNLQGEDVVIKRLSPPASADEETLALALSEQEIANLANCRAKAALVPLGASIEGIATIEAERPRLAMMKLLHLFYIPIDAHPGVHERAVIDPTAKLGENVSIGANVVIGRGCVIGNNTKIAANSYVGKFVEIGNNCLFHPGVNIGDYAKIGNNVIIQHGASIAADGFSFVTETQGTIEAAKEHGKVEGDFSQQKIYKIPSLGSVTIGDDVEIGANACIDSGTVENTVIGRGTKIDDLVMIGHNCKIGENCLIVSQVGISGSVVVGDRTVIAGQAGIADHIKIGADSIVMAKSGVSKDFPEKSIIIGQPAVHRKEFIKQLKAMKDASKFADEIRALKKEIEELKKDK
ncbi:MAG: UDP-3-O-(3-hydroxymyristoyl)glucosamine N-acyltransferase [Candidatus Gastranaerophilales bacterium]|mgnify:CR=1 FL=1|nr:UDP-3-O-(3-hydroxymyristoyl)glucosamine N-acyltransferase [Candidatus Gastranaerophilales bacterium]